MSDSLEKQQFKRWLRRPTLFIANAWYLLAAAGLYIVSYGAVFIDKLLSSMGAGGMPAEASTAVSLLYEVLFLALPAAWYAAHREGVSQSMRLDPPRLSMMLLAMGAACAGVMLSNCVSAWWMLTIENLGGRLIDSGVPIPQTPDALLQSIFLLGVVPGVCEELLFRGGLMGAWERRGTKQALLVTTALFALLHGSVLGLPTQLIIGLALGYVLLVSDSLYVSMLYHTTHNAATLVLSYFSRLALEGEAEYATMAESVAAAGGYGALFSQTLFMGMLFLLLLLIMRQIQRGRGVQFEKITEGDPAKLGWRELLLLLVGLLTVSLNYIMELMQICGMI